MILDKVPGSSHRAGLADRVPVEVERDVLARHNGDADVSDNRLVPNHRDRRCRTVRRNRSNRSSQRLVLHVADLSDWRRTVNCPTCHGRLLQAFRRSNNVFDGVVGTRNLIGEAIRNQKALGARIVTARDIAHTCSRDADRITHQLNVFNRTTSNRAARLVYRTYNATEGHLRSLFINRILVGNALHNYIFDSARDYWPTILYQPCDTTDLTEAFHSNIRHMAILDSGSAAFVKADNATNVVTITSVHFCISSANVACRSTIAERLATRHLRITTASNTTNIMVSGKLDRTRDFAILDCGCSMRRSSNCTDVIIAC